MPTLRLAHRRCDWKKVRKYEPVSLHNLPGSNSYAVLEHRPTICERMNLPVFAAWVHISRKLTQQIRIEPSPGERAFQLARIHARQVSRKTVRDHFFGELPSIAQPQRKNRRHAATGKLLLTIRANVFEKKISKHNVPDAFVSRAVHSHAHRLLVNLIRTRRR